MLRLQGKVTRVNEPRPYELDDGTKGVSQKFTVLSADESDIHVVTVREGQDVPSKGDYVDLAVTPMVSGGRLKIRNEGPYETI